jgi:hypothetical protein
MIFFLTAIGDHKAVTNGSNKKCHLLSRVSIASDQRGLIVTTAERVTVPAELVAVMV